jgi:hypothetical protein
MPMRVRGLLKYFQTRKDIRKYSRGPSHYELTAKELGKLKYWNKKSDKL